MMTLLFRPVDLSALAFLIISVFLLSRLLRMRLPNRASRALAVFNVVIAVEGVLWLFVSTSINSWTLPILYLWSLVFAFLVLALVQYVYRITPNTGTEPEIRLVTSAVLFGIGAIAISTAYRVWRLLAGNAAPDFFFEDILVLIGLLWAESVILRHIHRISKERDKTAIWHVYLPTAVGILLFILPGLISALNFWTAQAWGVDFVSILSLSFGATLIGFSFLFYFDPPNARVYRVVAVSLLILQALFAFLGVLQTAHFQQMDGVVFSPANLILPTSMSVEELANRRVLDQWTRPVLIFEAAMGLLFVILVPAASRRTRMVQKYSDGLGISRDQQEIIALAAEGLTNQEIAERLFITRSTVRYHLRAIYKALDLPDRDALIAWHQQN